MMKLANQFKKMRNMEGKIENMIGGRCLGCFVIKNSYAINNGLESFDAILFTFEGGGLEVLLLPDTDELTLAFVEDPWNLVTNKGFVPLAITNDGWKLQMYWRCQNSNGYDDMVVLGFQDLHPKMIVLSEGSGLKLFEVSKFGSGGK